MNLKLKILFTFILLMGRTSSGVDGISRGGGGHSVLDQKGAMLSYDLYLKEAFHLEEDLAFKNEVLPRLKKMEELMRAFHIENNGSYQRRDQYYIHNQIEAALSRILWFVTDRDLPSTTDSGAHVYEVTIDGKKHQAAIQDSNIVIIQRQVFQKMHEAGIQHPTALFFHELGLNIVSQFPELIDKDDFDTSRIQTFASYVASIPLLAMSSAHLISAVETMGIAASSTSPQGKLYVGGQSELRDILRQSPILHLNLEEVFRPKLSRERALILSDFRRGLSLGLDREEREGRLTKESVAKLNANSWEEKLSDHELYTFDFEMLMAEVQHATRYNQKAVISRAFSKRRMSEDQKLIQAAFKAVDQFQKRQEREAEERAAKEKRFVKLKRQFEPR